MDIAAMLVKYLSYFDTFYILTISDDESQIIYNLLDWIYIIIINF